jgi:putative inorganic carbon (HCO3(-)) transporter
VVLLFTRSRSGLFGFAVSDILLWILIFVFSRKNKQLLPMVAIFHVILAIIVFFNGSNVAQIDKYFSLEGMKNAFANRKTTPTPPPPGYSPPVLEAGGTESGTIRKYVWQGAVNAWKSSTKALLIGTGTETFAFAFYKFRPAGHNLTSEWDFLYNKAHNEYLNYLATTGSFGLLSYLLFLGTFIVWFVKTSLFSKKEDPAIPHEQRVTQYGLFAGWVSILVTNFFGFSVVIIQIFLFLFPAVLIALRSSLNGVQTYTKKIKASFPTTPLIVGVVMLMMLLLSSVAALWYADTLYASSYRMARSGQYAQAKLSIEKAIFLNPTEPLYHDEISTTLAAIAVASFEQQNATVASEFAKRSLLEIDPAIRTSPQNVNFWKTRTKLYYSFSSLDPKFNEAAIGALEKAAELSPNDAKVYYNLAILYGRQGQNDKSIELLKKSIALKPNYHDAYYALYVFYTEIKEPDLGRQVLEEYMQKIDPNDQNFAEILGKTKP